MVDGLGFTSSAGTEKSLKVRLFCISVLMVLYLCLRLVPAWADSGASIILQGGIESQGYIWTTVDVSGTRSTQITGINDAGQIVGWYKIRGNDWASEGYHGFLYTNGSLITIDFPGAIYTMPQAINNAGQIVGMYRDANHTHHGFLYSNGKYTTIDFPGVQETLAYGINDCGQIVGAYVDANGRDRGFVYSDGNFTQIDFPDARQTRLYGINNAGQIVGQYVGQDGLCHAFLYSEGHFTTINFTEARGINDAGQIVGNYPTGLHHQHGFLYSNGVSITIDFPNATYTHYLPLLPGIDPNEFCRSISGGATGCRVIGNRFVAVEAAQTELCKINNLGQIVGHYFQTQEKVVGFVAMPKKNGQVPLTNVCRFTDMVGHWAEDIVSRLVGKGAVSGYPDGTFKPDDNVTRAEFAKMVTVVVGLTPDASAVAGFADAGDIPAWAKGYVGAAVKAGLIKGYEDGTFRANRQITRAELAVMIARALKATEKAKLTFKDAADIPAWAAEDVARAVAGGIIKGYEDDTFRPANAANRAETAAIVFRLLNAVGK